ncbi:YdcF family protein [Sneathiella chungangensis]|uniref:YdcF family protein n=1 Tax=Sneathiella chungangensis TaxID=1418234 RepID=A0A845MKH8_9PROT|nr:YdcF family protein [Sneathiella chungangensis]MZR24251.1 YdcF family protein [Sneathiella chungangensis]
MPFFPGKIIAAVFLFLCLWAGGFLTFMGEVEKTTPVPAQNVDGIVVLTGTPARLTAGFDLLKENENARLLVSGVNSKVTRETLRQATGQSEEIMNCCVDLGRLARNTEGNAYETSLWAKSHNFDNIAIVTSAYHMPRSLVELKRQMPDVKLIAYPVASDTLELTGWRKNPRAFLVVAGEFNKYVFSLIRARLYD